MRHFLCGWEQIQEGNTGSHIPQMQKRMILLYLRVCLIFHHTGWKMPENKVTPSATLFQHVSDGQD